jgi:hypothetical protein
MSFFAKQKQKAPLSSSKTPTNKCKESSKKVSESLQKPCIFKNPSREGVKVFEWDCEACTFHNKKRRHVTDLMVCEICGTKHNEVIEVDDRDIPSHKVTPASLRKGDSVDPTLNNPLMRSSINNEANQIITPSEPGIMTIDGKKEERIDVVPRMLDSSLENPIVLCDVNEEPSRKKRKLSHRPVQSQIVCEDGTKSKATRLLSFSVSKNSGRITIHYGDDGESSLINFNVEEIVTKETVDRLLEARLSRNHNTASSIKLIYNQSALSKGKLTKLLKTFDDVETIMVSLFQVRFLTTFDSW